MSLTVALAVYNEEKNLPSCLDSFYDFADEIVIVDGESTDNTLELLKKYDKDNKIKIIVAPNPLMFHLNKQKAIDASTKNWILQLDADEHVSPELKKEILDTISRDNQDTAGYWIPRINYFLGKPLKKGGQYPDYTIRLYKKGSAHLPCKSVHEQAEVKGAVGYLKADLLHYPFPTFSAYMDKWDRYSSQEAQLLFKKGMRPSTINFVNYIVVKPKIWFIKTYFRHKGFQDGFAGYIFSLFSAIQNWAIYIKLYEKSHER